MSLPPPPIDAPLTAYFAVQLQGKETSHHVAEVVLKAAKEIDLLFRRLEVLDTLSVGGASVVRMRADILNPYPLIDRIHAAGRAVISAGTGGEYIVRFPGGRTGRYPTTTMHAVAKLGQARMYRGTRIKRWECQFEAA